MTEQVSKDLLTVSGKLDKEKNYWMEKLSGDLQKTNFPYDFHKPGAPHASVDFSFPPDLVAKLDLMTNKSQHNLFMMLMAGVTLLLNKYTGHTDILIGAPIYQQPVDGEFVNTMLTIRNQFSPDASFKELIIQVKKNLAEANDHLNYPIDRLLYHLHIPVDQGFSLFETVMMLENIHHRKYIRDIQPGILFSFIQKDHQSIHGTIEYNAGLYRDESIRRFISHFINIMQGIDKTVNNSIGTIDILDDSERETLLSEFNNTAFEYPGDKTVIQLFEEQVARVPGNIALFYPTGGTDSDGMDSITYLELYRTAMDLAYMLVKKGIGPDSIVAVMFEPCLEMPAAILGILKAGGAYLPIDPDYPEERIRYILNNSNAALFLTNSPTAGDTNVETYTLYIDEILKESSDRNNDAIPPEFSFTPAGSSNLAYVIYTSGTTGQPKGVLLENRNLVNYVSWLTDSLQLTQDDRTILTSSYAFDLGYTSIYGALLNGGQLHLLRREDYIFGESLLAHVKEHQITFLKVTPSLFSIMAYSPDFSMKSCSSLKTILLGGEPIVVADVAEAHQRCPHIRFMNHYGPTETTIGSVARFIDFQQLDQYKECPTIGKPIHNTRVYIMGPGLTLMPAGSVGELWIAGDSVARGYLHQPELTARRFVQNPFHSSYPSHLSNRSYKTGDLARWTADGHLEFLGRIDHQVKIRGFRIELGEIENKLTSHPALTDAVVLVKSDDAGNKFMCAYIVPNTADALEKMKSPAETLRAYLLESLPDYMIPSYFIPLEFIPLTPNGKVDRHALPEPQSMAGMDYVAPQNDTEVALAQVWQDVFSVEQVGVNDNFFNLGGDSIKAIQITARLRKASLKLEVRDLFANPTINELGKFVKRVKRVIDQGPVQGYVPLTPVQQWFFENDFTNKHHFNLSVMVCHKDRSIDETLLSKVLAQVVRHHDALRMIYPIDDESGNRRVRQVNRRIDAEGFRLEIVTIDSSEDDETVVKAHIKAEADRIQSGIDIETGPLLNAGLFKTPFGDHLLLALHHLVADGVSWRILLEDLNQGYKMAQKGEEIIFQEKTDSFKVWSEKLRDYAVSRDALREAPYWRRLADKPIPQLPVDYSIEESQRIIGNNCTLDLHMDETQTAQLLKDVHRVYNTGINDMLLTALGMALSAWTGARNIPLHMEGHGRESIMEAVDVSRTVGWFTSHYPVILEINKDDSIGVKIKRVKETLRHVPNNGIGYGILKYLTSPDRLEGTPLNLQPEINFNYLGSFDTHSQNETAAPSQFYMSPLGMGEIISPRSEEPYTLDISGIVVSGCLTLSISFNKYEYETSTIQKILDNTRQNLIAIINHCTGKEEIELTPSDVGDDDLSLEELNEIEDMIQF